MQESLLETLILGLHDDFVFGKSDENAIGSSGKNVDKLETKSRSFYLFTVVWLLFSSINSFCYQI